MPRAYAFLLPPVPLAVPPLSKAKNPGAAHEWLARWPRSM